MISFPPFSDRLKNSIWGLLLSPGGWTWITSLVRSGSMIVLAWTLFKKVKSLTNRKTKCTELTCFLFPFRLHTRAHWILIAVNPAYLSNKSFKITPINALKLVFILMKLIDVYCIYGVISAVWTYSTVIKCTTLDLLSRVGSTRTWDPTFFLEDFRSYSFEKNNIIDKINTRANDVQNLKNNYIIKNTLCSCAAL